MNLSRDSERMVLADLIYGADVPAGWALLENPTDKERRFCARLGIEVVEGGIGELLDAEMAA